MSSSFTTFIQTFVTLSINKRTLKVYSKSKKKIQYTHHKNTKNSIARIQKKKTVDANKQRKSPRKSSQNNHPTHLSRRKQSPIVPKIRNLHTRWKKLNKPNEYVTRFPNVAHNDECCCRCCLFFSVLPRLLFPCYLLPGQFLEDLSIVRIVLLNGPSILYCDPFRNMVYGRWARHCWVWADAVPLFFCEFESRL